MRLFSLALLLATSSAFASPVLDVNTPEPVLSDFSVGKSSIKIKLGEEQKALAAKLGVTDEGKKKSSAFTFKSGAATFKGRGHLSEMIYDVKAAGDLSVRVEGEPVSLDPSVALADLQIAGCAAPDGNTRACEGGLWIEKSTDGLKVHVARSSIADLSGSWRVSKFLVLGNGRMRPDLGKNGPGQISATQIKLGDSRCEPKEENVNILTRENWLALLDVSTDEFNDVPVVFDVSTGCTDVLAHLYAVGDKMIAHRAQVLYVFERRSGR